MLSQRFRFHGRGALGRLYKNSRSVRSQTITARARLAPHRSTARFAVVVSKKIAKSAVVRNRIRRRVYEIVRKNWDVKQVMDCAIIVTSPEVINLSHSKLETEVISVLNRVQKQLKK